VDSYGPSQKESRRQRRKTNVKRKRREIRGKIGKIKRAQVASTFCTYEILTKRFCIWGASGDGNVAIRIPDALDGWLMD
jgi:hypothetical protein